MNLKLCRFSDLHVNIYQACSCLYILHINFFRLIIFSFSGVNCDVHYWILKTNYLASRTKITISARLHLFCFSYHCLLVSVLNMYFPSEVQREHACDLC